MASGKRVATKAPGDATAHKKSRTAPTQDMSTRRVTRGMTKEAVINAVFNTTELLEKIISHLPWDDAFVFQRVNQNFNSVIEASPEIQELRFQRLQGAPVEKWMANTESDFGVRKVDAQNPRKPGDHGELLTPVVLNPILKIVERPWYFPHPYLMNSVSNRFERSEYPAQKAWSGKEYVKIDVWQGLLGNDPSFLKTYITDPPCYKAQAGIAAEYLVDPKMEPEHGVVMGAIIESETGLTFGDVLRAYGDVEMVWKDWVGYSTGVDIQLEEMMETAGCPFVVDEESYPTCTLQLFDVCIPTDENRAHVAAEYEEATS